MKILNVVGARPNFVKIAPLLREMSRHREIRPVLVHTGQHYDERLSGLFFREMKSHEPDINLGVGSGTQSWQTAEILQRIEPVLIEQQPDLLLVVGDVNSTIAASLAAAKLGIPIAHVEAGLRSFDRAMPEEINRVLTDALASYLFVTEAEAVKNLLREGRSREQIYLVGNVMIDSLRHYLPLAEKSGLGRELGLAREGNCQTFAVLTLHRPSNVDSSDNLENLLRTLNVVGERLPVVFPVHPRTEAKLKNLRDHHFSNLRMIAPLGYLDFLYLLRHAKLVLTDSGGIQEETTALGVPCLTLRENTERPVTVSHGTNAIVGLDAEKIYTAVDNILAGKWKNGRVPQLWDGHSSKRIVDILMKDFLCADRNSLIYENCGRTVASVAGRQNLSS